MDPIDVAHERFKELRPEIEGYLASVRTEADVRLKIINRVLVEILHWPFEAIEAEPNTESGYADYALLESGLTRVILEAKRDGLSLGLESRTAGRSYKLSGGVFRSAAAKEGIDQAIRYCGEKNAELACVTNGTEWFLFRGSRMGDGRNTRDGQAFVFPCLKSLEEKFALFYNLLGRESAAGFGYRPYFQDAEGQPIRTSVFQKSLRPVGSARQLPGSDLANDIDRIMGAYFQRLTGDDDPGMLEECFVETSDSLQAERQIARIADDIVDRIQSLDTGKAEALTELVERVSQSGRHEFVLIVGTKGAGKTTFISRFFQNIASRKILTSSVILWVDVKEHSGNVSDVVDWLNSTLIASAETALFEDGKPSFREIQGMFFDEYQRLARGNWAPIYEEDESHVQFHAKFGDKIEEMRQSDKREYLRGLIRHVVTNRKYLPILVFDNADHFEIEFQQAVYQFARSLFEVEVCLVIMPMTDRTSWQLSKHGAFQSFEHESFFLPAPGTEEVIRKRIEFIDARLELEKVEPNDRYSIAGNIHLSIKDVSLFTRSLQQVFLQTSSISDWLGSLSNYDVRRTLALARRFISSPHLQVNDLAAAYLAKSAMELPTYRAVRALIRQKHDIYPVGLNEFVQNVFALNLDMATSPLLGVRILQLLSDVSPDERRNALIDVDQIEAYLGAMSVENRAVRLWLDALLKTGLILDYDATINDIDSARQVELSPSGRQHLLWALDDFQYLHGMMEVTPLLQEAVYANLTRDRRSGSGSNKHRQIGKFINYLLDEDLVYCQVPVHEAYQSQRRLTATLTALAKRLADWPDRSRRA